MLLKKSLKAKKKILASQLSNARSRINEQQLEQELSQYFKSLEKEVQSQLEIYYNDTLLLQGQINIITSPIVNSHETYYGIIEDHIRKEYGLGQDEANRLVKTIAPSVVSQALTPTIRSRGLFGTLKWSEEELLRKSFIASENTLNRVDENINQILSDGYKSGKGIDVVAQNITRRFDQLSTWESKRIARTEIHTAHNQGIMRTYTDLGVEYTQWIAADDDRTRDSHIEVNGEIIPFGETYSNGLEYPGDTNGPIEEWINCRCSHAPFIIPEGYMAPPFSPFREEDLIKIQ